MAQFFIPRIDAYAVRLAQPLRLRQADTNHQQAQNHATIHTSIGTCVLACFVQLTKNSPGKLHFTALNLALIVIIPVKN